MFLTGQASAVSLDGSFDAAFAGTRTLFIDLTRDANKLAGGSRASQFMLLDQVVREALETRAPADKDLLHAAGREALRRYLAGGRVIFAVDRAVDIRQVIAFAQRSGMKPVIVGGAEAWVVANDLAKAKVPVLLDPFVNLPADFDKIGARLDNAALLNSAGVRIAFTLKEDPTMRAKRIRQAAGNAAAHGLPRDVALAAITANPADIFGIGSTRGRIAPGQAADLALWTGDPLEVSTVATHVWIAGRTIEMTSRQTELRDRYLEKLRAQQAR
jgi:imidazolonepropionase-like amidohydrolase